MCEMFVKKKQMCAVKAEPAVSCFGISVPNDSVGCNLKCFVLYQFVSSFTT